MNFRPNAEFLAFTPHHRLGAKTERLTVFGAERFRGFLLLGLLLLALPCAAQLEVGDNTKITLSGDIGFNYNGNINQGASGHSLGFAGDANLNGSYYNPNFLNFNVQPYYDRTHSSSVFGMVTNTSGVNSSMNLFSGSHFPGTVSYDKGINSTGEFGVPGSTIGLAEHGDHQGFALSWSELLPKMPTLTATYAIGNGSSSIYGSQATSTQTNRDFSLLSTYLVAGFRLAGGYTHRNVDGTFSELLEGIPEPVKATTASNNYQANAQHSFPMGGAFAISWSRTGYDYAYHDSHDTANSGASDTLNGNLYFRPATKLTVGFNANYNDSLLGTLPEAVITSGTANVPLGTFRAFLVGVDANYQLLRNLSLHGAVNREEEKFLGQSYGATQFAGNLNYNLERKLLGSLTFSVGVIDSANKEGNTSLGFIGNMNFDRKVAGWDVSANLSYSQNVQTLFLVYTTSSLGYVTNLRRRFSNRTMFMVGYGGSHSGITSIAGSSSSANRGSGTFVFRTYSLNGFYSKSNGSAAFTPNGLVAIPPTLPPTVLPPGSVIVYDATSYGFNASAAPLRRLTLSAGYASSKGDTVDPLLSTFTKNDLLNFVGQYRLRKIYVNGGYTRLRQSISTPGTVPVTVTTFYIGISRWFNFF